MKRIRSHIIWAVLALVLAAGYVIGRCTVVQAVPPVQPGVSILREKDSRYNYIQPLLTCSLDSRQSAGFQKLNDDVTGIITREKKAGAVDDVGFYFRDVNTGDWTGVNEDEKFSPASLLKVDIMIAAFKLAESDPAFLKKPVKLVISQDLNANEIFKPAAALVSGNIYTIDDLVKAMIVNSDNNALSALQNFIGPKALQRVYDDLHLQIQQDNPVQDSTSPKAYSLTLRVLYNSTYLSRDMSNKALELLSETKFNSGIERTIPSNLKVAEKFGERTVMQTNGTVVSREFHDCGLVYHPNSPYILCVMTHGKDFDGLLRTIGEISAAAYNYVDSGTSRAYSAVQTSEQQ
jgi:beta-lactamase class A